MQKSPLFLSISLVFREPSFTLLIKEGSRRGAHLFWLSRILLGGTERKKGRRATMHGTSRPCLRGTVERATHECCQVERADNSNVFGLFFEQESQRYLTFTMIWTPSSYGRARGLMSINMMMRIETRSTTGVFVVQDNKTINNSNVSMRLIGSTGEPDGRGDRIWDGGLIVSL